MEAHSCLISSLGWLTIRPGCRRLLEPVHFPVLIHGHGLLSLFHRPVWKQNHKISLGTKQSGFHLSVAFVLVLYNRAKRLEKKSRQFVIGRTCFPALWISYVYWLRVLIGSLGCVSFMIGQKALLWFWFYDTRLKTALNKTEQSEGHRTH